MGGQRNSTPSYLSVSNGTVGYGIAINLSGKKTRTALMNASTTTIKGRKSTEPFL